LEKQYDILVIGSGLGGLVSALILAKEGLKVCVLEKNNQYGGNLQTFSREKLIFDTGVHYLGGLSEGQNLHQYFSYLEIADELPLKKLDEKGFDRISFDDDPVFYPHSQGYDGFVESLTEIFPEEKDNIISYCKGIQKVCEQFPRYSLFKKEKYSDEILYTNAKDFIDSMTQNEKLRAVLAGSNFLYAGIGEKTPLYVHALTVNSYIESAYKCVNGGSQITKLLIRQLRKYGAEVFKHSEVKEFIFNEENIVETVKTKCQNIFYAKQFISNIDIRQTVDLVGHEKFKKSYINRIYDLKPTVSCFSVYIKLKNNSLPYFNHNFYNYSSVEKVWNASSASTENWPEWYMLSATHSKQNPEFAESLTALAYMNFDEVKQWENTQNTVADTEERGVEYERFKQEKAKILIQKIAEKHPQILDCIEVVYTSSPLSYRDYIGCTEGGIYGYVKDSHNPLKTVFSAKTKIPNLFLTGQTVNMHGILGVTIGAFITCSEILGTEVIDERLSQMLIKMKLKSKKRTSGSWLKKKNFFVFFLYLNIFLCSISCGTRKSVKHIPETQQYSLEIPKVQKINDSTFSFNENYLTKNKQQLWELYIKGNPLQLGYNNGALTQNLMQKQEEIFFSKVEGFVPSKFKQNLLRGFLKWYNRKMYRNVRNDFQAELYGLSRYSSDQYDFIAPKFRRAMYLHGAHDIGHAMQDLMMVGCSSLAVWNENTEDGDLLIGRNFDFYVGDDFAKNKLIEFVEPEDGIAYLSVSWPGMIGVVSGMNKEGITVTINAGKSKIPLTAKTPISFVTREILQYAKTIDEAIDIAKKRKVFVSESILVGSANDKNAVIIEVSPDNFGVFKVENSSRILCTNHFQSDAYEDDKRNQKQIAESHSEYRYEKLQELLSENKKLNPEKMAAILRDKSGLKGEKIGYGNEKALNQLLAHHAVIFSPEKRLVWVSSNPYQLGEFVCYDLNEIFSDKRLKNGTFAKSELNITKDPFADSQEFENYEIYKIINAEITDAIEKDNVILTEDSIPYYESLNPDFWYVYYQSGRYYFKNKEFSKAKIEFEKALTKEITTIPDTENVEKYLKKTERKLK